MLLRGLPCGTSACARLPSLTHLTRALLGGCASSLIVRHCSGETERGKVMMMMMLLLLLMMMIVSLMTMIIIMAIMMRNVMSRKGERYFSFTRAGCRKGPSRSCLRDHNMLFTDDMLCLMHHTAGSGNREGAADLLDFFNTIMLSSCAAGKFHDELCPPHRL